MVARDKRFKLLFQSEDGRAFYDYCAVIQDREIITSRTYWLIYLKGEVEIVMLEITGVSPYKQFT